MVDIFKEGKESVIPKWAKFVNAGDSVQGTYVGKIVGQKDSYGNEQVIFQLLQEDGSIFNVGFGLNKKVLLKDMEAVTFGHNIGFKYKGKVTFTDRYGKQQEVKDFALFWDPKIVNEKWLKENRDNMPTVTHSEHNSVADEAEAEYNKIGTDEGVPFSTPGNLTNEDKLGVIEKLAKDKLGATDAQSAKDKVMEVTGIAYIPVNFDKIIEALSAK